MANILVYGKGLLTEINELIKYEDITYGLIGVVNVCFISILK